jgi:hypothetical protein
VSLPLPLPLLLLLRMLLCVLQLPLLELQPLYLWRVRVWLLLRWWPGNHVLLLRHQTGMLLSALSVLLHLELQSRQSPKYSIDHCS